MTTNNRRSSIWTDARRTGYPLVTAFLVLVLSASLVVAQRIPEKKSPKRVRPTLTEEQDTVKRETPAERPTETVSEPKKSTPVKSPGVAPQTAPVQDKALAAPPPLPTEEIRSETAEAQAAAAINLDWVSINHGGAIEVAAGPYKLGVSVAQSVAGFVESGPYQLGLGFWYGTTQAAGPTCACLCFGDPDCDSISNIVDAARVIDVAFRNGGPFSDPSPVCPWTSTDVNCDGLTTIVDAAKVVDVVFRNGDKSTLWCDPCAPI